MSGSVRNEWNSYLNGNTSHYNFSYRSDTVTPNASNSIPSVPVQTVELSKKNNKNIIPTQKGKTFKSHGGGGKRRRLIKSKQRYTRRK
jgi:hypothetical protein